jgi:Holliday junction resolvasome RuvABC endonuclease subunit
VDIDRDGYFLLGIDPGSQACGWAVGTLDGIPKDSGAIVIPPSVNTAVRVFTVADALAALAERWKVSSVYCEAPLVFRGIKTALVLGGLSTTINYAIWKRSGGVLLVNYLRSSEIRKNLGFKGKQTKELALKCIRQLMTDMGMPFEKPDKRGEVTLGEEDRLEAIGTYWAGCTEISRGLDSAEEA